MSDSRYLHNSTSLYIYLFVCITLVTQPPTAPGTSKTVDSLEGMGFQEEEVDEAAMESKIMMDISLSPQAQPALPSLFLKFVLD